MKSLLLAIMLVAGVAQAQYLVPGNGDGHHKPHAPQPAPYPGHNPYNPYEPNPYNPYPSYPNYGSDYGPARTYRWLDLGTEKVEKFGNETIRHYVGHRLVNEVLLRSSESDVQIIRAYARLSNGRTTNITTGLIREGYDVRLRLDYNYSVRVESIEIVATSQNLFGSRARLNIMLGLAE